MKVQSHSRLLCLVRYRRRGRLLALEWVAVGPAYASHVRLGLRMSAWGSWLWQE
jgi:hypothetical protein